MATTYRYQAVIWKNEDGLHAGRLLDDDQDGTATARSRKGVVDQLKEYLKFVHASDGEYYIPMPDFFEPEMRKVKVRLHPEYSDDRRTYACKESVELRLPCAVGKRDTGLFTAVMPTIDVEFNFNDLRSFAKLAAHYVQGELKGKTPQQLSRDLPPESASLEEIVISARSRKRSTRPKLDAPSLMSVADPVTSKQLRKISRTWEREEEIRAIAKVLGEDRTNLCIVGEPGCGKTSVLVEAARAVENERSSRLPSGESQPPVFWLTSAGRLIAGMQYLGEWQQRCEEAIDELSQIGGILCFESLHDLFRLGGSEPESSIAAFLAPFVKNGDLRIVAEATPTELDACDRLLPGVVDQLQIVELPAFDTESAQRVLRRAGEAVTRDQKIVFSPACADAVGQLFHRFQPYIAFPGKVIQFMGDTTERVSQVGEGEVRLPDVHANFSRTTGLPEIFIDDTSTLTKQEIEAELSGKILGQPEPLGALADMLVKFKAGLNDPQRPLGVFLFAGPTGVGKTAAVRALGDMLFGERPEKDRLVRLDMSEYADGDAPMRLLGNPFGKPSELVRRIRANPFTILLLDEIEKAAEEVFDIFLNVFEEARLTDAFGRVTAFNSTIIIMTSNLGAKTSGMVGFGSGGDAEENEAAAARTDPSVARKFFRPEFFNRLDRAVTFEPLRYATVLDITRKELDDLAAREGIAARGLKLRWDERLIAHLAETGFDPKYGARPLQRKIEETVIVPLARHLVQHPGLKNTTLSVEMAPEGVMIVAGIDNS